MKGTVKGTEGAVPAGMRCLRYGVCQGNAMGTPRVRWGCGREGAVKGAVKGAGRWGDTVAARAVR